LVATWKGTKNQPIFLRENQATPSRNQLLGKGPPPFSVDSVSNDIFLVGISSGIARISGRMFSLPKTEKRKVEVVETFPEVNNE